jgi:hypothetical protein
MSITAKFPGSGSDMLTASSIVVGLAIENKEALITKRPGWADPFFPNMKTRIDNAFPNCLGIDPKKPLRQSTNVLNDFQQEALADVGDLYVQVKEDFKSDENVQKEILASLGFAAFYKKAKTKNQGALISLLFKYQEGIGPVRETLIVAGNSPELLDRISGYAVTLNNVNITQESLKTTTKEPTGEALMELNEIYAGVISVAKIARRFFLKDPIKKELFNFTKIMEQQHNGGASKSDEAPAPSPEPPTEN